MKLRSLLSYSLLSLVTLALIAGCTNPAIYIKTTTETEAASAVTSVDAVRLGYSAWPRWFPWQVSQEQGIFKAESASVNLQWFDGYLESISTLTAGH